MTKVDGDRQRPRTGSADVIVAPAVWFMDRLRYAPKFIVIGLLLLVPFGVVARMQYDLATASIEVNESEHRGVHYIAAARDFLNDVQRHRLLSSASFYERAPVREELSRLRAQAGVHMAEVDDLDRAHGTLLQTTRKWTAIKGEWASITAQSFPSAAASEAAHDKVTAMILSLILDDAGNYSLVLDPDRDSYWLMDAYVVKLPAITETIGKITALALRVPAKGGMGLPDKLEMAGFDKLLERTVNDLVAVNMNTALKENRKNLHQVVIDPNLAAKAEAVQQKTRELLAFLAERFLATDKGEASTQEIVQRSLAASDEAYDFYKDIDPELDKLIFARSASYERHRKTSLAISVLTAALLVYLFGGLYVSVRRAVAALDGFTQRMIAGTTESFSLRSQDEIGQIASSYNSINAALVDARALRREIVSAIQNLQSASAELQASANQQTTAAKQQAGATHETTATVKELLATTHQIADSARKVAQIAAQTATAARSGDLTVQKAQDGLGGIKRQVDVIVDHMLDLGRKSQHIGGILEIINELAEQTNILAINATIEAAGAGEVGKRFAVVADEIRKLADRVGGSTKDIRTLIEEMRTAVNTTVMATEQGTKAVDVGTRQVGDVATAFGQIAGMVETTTEATREIELSTKQQTTAVEQVSVAMMNVVQAAKETEATSSQLFQTSSQLTALSKDLSELIREGAAE